MNIEDPALKAVVVKAIYDSIPAETREKMLTDAVAALMAPPNKTSIYDRDQPSKLAEIFEMEVYSFARQAVKERFATDPQVQGAVKDLCANALTKLLTDENLATDLAGVIARCISKARDAMDR